MKQFVIVYPVITVTIYFHSSHDIFILNMQCLYQVCTQIYIVSICTNMCTYTNKCILEATLFRLLYLVLLIVTLNNQDFIFNH